MRKLKLFLWLLTTFSLGWSLFALAMPDLATSVSRAPVNVVNAVIVAVASELGGEPLFVLSSRAADYVVPMCLIGGACFLILCTWYGIQTINRLQEAQQLWQEAATRKAFEFGLLEGCVRRTLTKVPGDSLRDQLAYAGECFEDYDAACELLNVDEGEELLPALEKLLQERPASSLTPGNSDNPRDLAGAAQP